METKEKNYLTFFDLIKKIFRYWYVLVLSILVICSSGFFWEKNKTIYRTATLSIMPLPIMEFEHLFSTTNFSKITDNIVNIAPRSDMDSFYMLNYTPLSLLYAYSLKMKSLIFRENFENEIYNEIVKTTTLTIGHSDSQVFLYIYVKSTRDKNDISKYFNWLANESNLLVKNDIISLVKKEIKETQNKINLLNEISSEDNVKIISNYQIKMLELQDVLAQPNKKYVYFEIKNTNYTSNSFGLYKVLILSCLLATMLGLIIILLLPDRKN